MSRAVVSTVVNEVQQLLLVRPPNPYVDVVEVVRLVTGSDLVSYSKDHHFVTTVEDNDLVQLYNGIFKINDEYYSGSDHSRVVIGENFKDFTKSSQADFAHSEIDDFNYIHVTLNETGDVHMVVTNHSCNKLEMKDYDFVDQNIVAYLTHKDTIYCVSKDGKVISVQVDFINSIINSKVLKYIGYKPKNIQSVGFFMNRPYVIIKNCLHFLDKTGDVKDKQWTVSDISGSYTVCHLMDEDPVKEIVTITSTNMVDKQVTLCLSKFDQSIIDYLARYILGTEKYTVKRFVIDSFYDVTLNKSTFTLNYGLHDVYSYSDHKMLPPGTKVYKDMNNNDLIVKPDTVLNTLMYQTDNGDLTINDMINGKIIGTNLLILNNGTRYSVGYPKKIWNHIDTNDSYDTQISKICSTHQNNKWLLIATINRWGKLTILSYDLTKHVFYKIFNQDWVCHHRVLDLIVWKNNVYCLTPDQKIFIFKCSKDGYTRYSSINCYDIGIVRNYGVINNRLHLIIDGYLYRINKKKLELISKNIFDMSLLKRIPYRLF